MTAFTQAEDWRGPAWVLTCRPSTHNLQNNSWHGRRVGDQGGQEGSVKSEGGEVDWRGGVVEGWRCSGERNREGVDEGFLVSRCRPVVI